MKLLHFLSDIARNTELQAAFREDPAGVMKRAGLSTVDQALIKDRNLEAVVKALGSDLQQLFRAPIVPWPGPQTVLTSFSPGTAARGESNIQVSGQGSSFATGMTCTLSTILGPSIPVTIDQVTVNNHTGDSSFTGTMSIPADARLGAYQAEVVALYGQSRLPDACTVTES